MGTARGGAMCELNVRQRSASQPWALRAQTKEELLLQRGSCVSWVLHQVIPQGQKGLT